MNRLQIEFTMVADALPEFTEKSDYGDRTKPLLCLHRDGHLETCVYTAGLDDDMPDHWYYQQSGVLCETVVGWAEFEVIGGEG